MKTGRSFRPIGVFATIMANKSPTQPKNNHASDLVEQAYSLTTNPEEYDQLVLTWEKRISSLVKKNALEIGANEHQIATGEDEHLLRAFTIIERLSAAEQTGAVALDDLLAAYTSPAILARPDGSIRATNNAASQILGVHTHINEIAVDSDNAKTLIERLSPNSATATASPTVLRAYGSDGQSLVLVFSPFHRDQEEPLTLIQTAEINWTKAVDQLLREGFSLTKAEISVTNSIVAGHSIADIAKNSDKSINTIRSQLSSVLAKTGARTQSDLVRLIAGISQIATLKVKPTNNIVAAAKALPDIEEHILLLPDGRKVAYRLIGPKGGRWAVFCHSMFGGPYLSAPARARLRQHNIRLLAVARPGFGETSPVKGGRETRHRTMSQDLKAVMADLGTGPCVLLGQEAGGGQGYTIAHFEPGLISAQVNFSSGIPFTKPEHIKGLPARMRGYMWTARLAPHILPLMIKGAVALLQKGKIELFHRTYYHGEGMDYETSQRSEVALILKKGAEFSYAQGHDAILEQTIDLSLDWSGYLDNFTHPTTLIHGEQNSQFPAKFVKKFADERQNVSFIKVRDGGLLLMHTHAELIIDVLDKQMKSLAGH
ncbi:hypothetical protein MNBD_ALPHA06-1859 [hydrothermal vent metagenome]|uniref:HTH luxR-type domain-containing protein n=1 Tax=hydrothermal vent metagenome TaxID=652676 RepID=A0A3B0S8S0_9ZZZZ